PEWPDAPASTSRYRTHYCPQPAWPAALLTAVAERCAAGAAARAAGLYQSGAYLCGRPGGGKADPATKPPRRQYRHYQRLQRYSVGPCALSELPAATESRAGQSRAGGADGWRRPGHVRWRHSGSGGHGTVVVQ